jgi:hypothetical protein
MPNPQRRDAVLQIWVAGFNLNIPINVRECFRIIDFWATLY